MAPMLRARVSEGVPPLGGAPGEARVLPGRLAEELGERFAHGIVLYRGRSVVPFGEKLAAWPISSLWSSP